MKVLVVTNMYPTEKRPFYGIFVKEQVDSLQKEGISVDVFFINGREDRLNYFKSVIGLLKKLKSNKYDIIHAHHTYCMYPIMIVRGITRIKTPIILTFHEGEVHKPDNVKLSDVDFVRRLTYSKTIKQLALSRVNIVITVHEGSVKALNFNGKCAVLPCGVDLGLFRPLEKEWCRKRLNLPFDKKIVFFPAAPNDNNKGFDVLTEALKFINGKDIHLLAAGNIHHQDIPYYMCASDVVVQPSLWEASPMVLKEAMAVNVPVVFTEVGDARLTVGNAKGCFLSERTPQDVAAKLENAFMCNGNSNGRTRIIEEGLGLPDVAKKIVKIYENLLNQNLLKNI